MHDAPDARQVVLVFITFRERALDFITGYSVVHFSINYFRQKAKYSNFPFGIRIRYILYIIRREFTPLMYTGLHPRRQGARMYLKCVPP